MFNVTNELVNGQVFSAQIVVSAKCVLDRKSTTNMAALGRKIPAYGVKVLNSPFRLRHISKFKYSSITGYASADKALQTVTGGRVDRWLGAYERTVGLTEVREAQGKVIQVSWVDISWVMKYYCVKL